MNPAHIHLLLNHLPVIGIPFSLLVLGHGLFRKNDEITRLGLLFLIAVAIITVPTFLTGEPAEKMLKALPGWERGYGHPHEEAGEVSVILTSMTGIIAFLSLVIKNHPLIKIWGPRAAAAMALIATFSLAYTANLGGKIRHPEVRDSVSVQN